MKIKSVIVSGSSIPSVKSYIKAVKAGKNSKPKVILPTSDKESLSKAIKNFDNQRKIIERARKSGQIIDKNKK